MQNIACHIKARHCSNWVKTRVQMAFLVPLYGPTVWGLAFSAGVPTRIFPQRSPRSLECWTCHRLLISAVLWWLLSSSWTSPLRNTSMRRFRITRWRFFFFFGQYKIHVNFSFLRRFTLCAPLKCVCLLKLHVARHALMGRYVEFLTLLIQVFYQLGLLTLL